MALKVSFVTGVMRGGRGVARFCSEAAVAARKAVAFASGMGTLARVSVPAVTAALNPANCTDKAVESASRFFEGSSVLPVKNVTMASTFAFNAVKFSDVIVAGGSAKPSTVRGCCLTMLLVAWMRERSADNCATVTIVAAGLTCAARRSGRMSAIADVVSRICCLPASVSSAVLVFAIMLL